MLICFAAVQPTTTTTTTTILNENDEKAKKKEKILIKTVANNQKTFYIALHSKSKRTGCNYYTFALHMLRASAYEIFRESLNSG
jgi:hypothetical protein